MSLYDVNCLQRSVAVRAVFKLWRKGAWQLLDELGLGREINTPFEDAMDYLPGTMIRTEQQTEVFLATLTDALRERVILAADLLTMSYRHIFQDDIANDAMLQGGNNDRGSVKESQTIKEQRPRKRSRSRR